MGLRKTEITVSEAHEIAGMKRRSQSRFNRDHSEPIEYGEEGEHLVLGTQYSEARAMKLFEQKLRGDYSMDEEDVSTAINGMTMENFGIGKWDDIGYELSGGNIDPTPRWKGWVVETGY